MRNRSYPFSQGLNRGSHRFIASGENFTLVEYDKKWELSFQICYPFFEHASLECGIVSWFERKTSTRIGNIRARSDEILMQAQNFEDITSEQFGNNRTRWARCSLMTEFRTDCGRLLPNRSERTELIRQYRDLIRSHPNLHDSSRTHNLEIQIDD